MFVELLGHKAEVAFNGQEALTKASRFKPEIIFLDIGLPGQSGIEVAKAIRHSEIYPTPRLVALTGWGTVETKQKTKYPTSCCYYCITVHGMFEEWKNHPFAMDDPSIEHPK
ncbi:MAG: response regulator [Flavobacteriia bacterium]|nr:response regulator [Flavobacteriia bacterium]